MSIYDDIFGRTFPFAIGFDRTFSLLERAAEAPSINYPPYNIIKEDDETFRIEIAVAGFDRSELKVSKEKNVLIVEGKKESGEDESYLHKGLASRSFKRSFTLADDVQVVGGDLKNGILIINLERVVPEEDKPQLIEIK
jgi:molecular chaperone IbpA